VQPTGDAASQHGGAGREPPARATPDELAERLAQMMPTQALVGDAIDRAIDAAAPRRRRSWTFVVSVHVTRA
jgi:hypothetical protein